MVGVEVNGYTIEPEADLSGAGLSGADLSGTDLSGTTADEITIWPEGFDPEAAGVIFED